MSASQLDVKFGYGASIVRQPVQLAGSSILCKAQNSEYAVGSIVSSIPAKPPAPVLNVQGATEVGICEDLVLDASGSTGNGGRPLIYTWGVKLGPVNSTIIQEHLTRFNQDTSIEDHSLLTVDFACVLRTARSSTHIARLHYCLGLLLRLW